MEKLEKIYNFINAKLAILFQILYRFIPSKVLLLIAQYKLKIKNGREFLILQKPKLLNYLDKLKSEVITRSKKFKHDADALGLRIQNFIKSKNKKTYFKQIWQQCKVLASNYANILKLKIRQIDVQNLKFYSFFAVASILIIAFISIIVYREWIAPTLNRSPAAVEQDFGTPRPPYYKQMNRTLALTHIKMPIYIESIHAMKSLTLDIAVQFTNRTAHQFTVTHEKMALDAIYGQLEVFSPGFIYTPEGRKIIQDKIKNDLERMLQKNQVEGGVETVFIIDIMGG